MAWNVWHKKFKGVIPIEDKDRAKQISFLSYRGFSNEHIQEVFAEKI